MPLTSVDGIQVGHLRHVYLITFGMAGQSRHGAGHFITMGGISVELFNLAQR